jgi:hypothetical protein
MRLTVLSRQQEKRNPTFAAVAAFGRSKKMGMQLDNGIRTNHRATRIIKFRKIWQFVNRDTRARFIAYTPAGSIKKDQALAPAEASRLLAEPHCPPALQLQIRHRAGIGGARGKARRLKPMANPAGFQNGRYHPVT